MVATKNAVIINGKELAAKIREALKKEVLELKDKTGVVPGLAVVVLGDNPASKVYVRNKAKACAEAGIRSIQRMLPAETKESELLELIKDLNSSSDVHGILVQLPLPLQINGAAVIEAISPQKDVDGFHPYNMGSLLIGKPVLQPCTPLGVMALLDSTGIDVAGKDAVVVGRSNIVGKPVSLMLLKRNATVQICHSKTSDLARKISSADIVVAAIGRPGFVKGAWIKEGAVVIDVGVNILEDGTLAGDVDFEGASRRASFITPVPGGVGPMTIAMLLRNTVEAAKKCAGV